MTAVRATEIQCDGTDCYEAVTDYGTARQLRAQLARRGWAHDRLGRDLCPDHNPHPVAPLPATDPEPER